MAHLNPQVSSAAQVETDLSTYHPLSGHAEQILLVSSATGTPFWFTFDTTAELVAGGIETKDLQFCPGHYPLLLTVNYPSYINLVSSGVAATFNGYIMEFY